MAPGQTKSERPSEVKAPADKALVDKAMVDKALANKPLMVIGPVSAGKSTLLAALGLGPKEVRKTEALVYNQSQSIDTPGEMMAIPRFYNALILNSSRAYAVLMVMNGQQPIWLPSKIAKALKAKVIGVVTKIDVSDQASIKKAELSLKNAGVEETFQVSPITGQGLSELRAWLEHSRSIIK
ncbi:MAG: EutP/PduV family microcompartment system protein [Deltaproteobacteria bacterium]|jgi:ethanolamine utilization protein EutP (predicted NTPase)|nr:EutP/PduV family microcompartment system protein [Deltaproteobacteria bacterium]